MELAGIVDDETVVLHTGSIALELEPGAGRVLDLLRRVRHAGRTAISYDPNVRLARRGSPDEGRRAVERVVALADLVKVSSEDLGWLYPGEDPVLAARRWVGVGPELVVLTAGGDGAVALPAGGQQVRRPAPQVEVVDTVGAGDAFTAGLLAALADRGALGRRPPAGSPRSTCPRCSTGPAWSRRSPAPAPAPTRRPAPGRPPSAPPTGGSPERASCRHAVPAAVLDPALRGDRTRGQRARDARAVPRAVAEVTPAVACRLPSAPRRQAPSRAPTA